MKSREGKSEFFQILVLLIVFLRGMPLGVDMARGSACYSHPEARAKALAHLGDIKPDDDAQNQGIPKIRSKLWMRP